MREQVQVGIHPNVDGRFSVLLARPSDSTPSPGALLSDWAAAGWYLAGEPHGNLGRGAMMLLQQGTMNRAQAILGIEVDGRRFRVVTRNAFGADEPKKWQKLKAWIKDGWTLVDQTGNLFHGALVVMVKPKDGGKSNGAKPKDGADDAQA